MADAWFHTPTTSLGGGALTQHKVLLGLKQFGRLAKDAANNDFEGV
jgi:hypothetical protein